MKKIREHPFIAALLVVMVPSTIGLIIAWNLKGEFQKTLFTASLTLIFGGFFGGLVKIFFDSYTIERQKREDNGRFITNVLSDLKSVYDRVGRVRIVVPAHNSAKTYGEEMRDLIQARITLINVSRALARNPRSLSQERVDQVNGNIERMQTYLKTLTEEFKENYPNLSRHQKVYETRVAAKLKEKGKHAEVGNVFSDETIKQELDKLECLQDLVSNAQKTKYRAQFEKPLDEASIILRQELFELVSGQ
jgi:response regulator RpfG family c-di-GMP phosphodiesterase